MNSGKSGAMLWLVAMLGVSVLGGVVGAATSPPLAEFNDTLAVSSPSYGGVPGGSAQPSTEGTTQLPSFSGPEGRLEPSLVRAESTAASSVDDSGNPTSFDATNLVDGRIDTAWRTAGDAIGQEIQFSFSQPVHLTSLGLVPGYAKIDPLSGVDRFLQNRRVSVVRWTSSEDESLSQRLADNRSSQTIPVDIVTQSITLVIMATTPPGDVSHDYTPISEIFFEGQQY